MVNNKNLKPIKKGELSKEEAKKRGAKGGKKSAEARRAKKTMREMLDYLLEKELTNHITGAKATTQEAILTAAIKKGINGDIRAIEFIRDTIGQKPIDRQEIIQLEPPVIIDNIK